jgi:hypothetical protein
LAPMRVTTPSSTTLPGLPATGRKRSPQWQHETEST